MDGALRDGVRQAVEALHAPQERYDESVRLVLRLLLGLIAEERGLAARPVAGSDGLRAALTTAGVDLGAVGGEELGAIYESLLAQAPGGERKISGSYYTPAPLVDAVLDAALEPLLARAAASADPEAALLALRVCDPACGAGGFLLAAGRRIAARLAEHRADAMRDVVARCLHGVDSDPMAVEVCRAALWLEAPGVPPASIAVRCGDSLAERRRESFDVVVGNPPWVSYSGRQAAPLDPARRRELRSRYTASTWLSAHGCFTELAARELARETVGLVLPEQVMHLPAYAPMRAAVAERMGVDEARAWGEGRFAGVTGPCVTLVLRAREARGRLCAADGALLSTIDPRARDWRAPRPRRSRWRDTWSLGRLVADVGVHTGNCARQLIKPGVPGSAREAPVLEGRQIDRYRCAPPAKTLDLGYRAGAGAYFTIRPRDAYERAAYCVRQTAGRPIVGPRLHATYFRNSLLALYSPDEGPMDVRFIVAVLNSAPMRAVYEATVADAGQRSFPQVKIGALRSLPMPKLDFRSPADRALHAELVGLVDARLASDDEALEAEIDARVGMLMGRSAEQLAPVRVRDGGDALPVGLLV